MKTRISAHKRNMRNKSFEVKEYLVDLSGVWIGFGRPCSHFLVVLCYICYLVLEILNPKSDFLFTFLCFGNIPKALCGSYMYFLKMFIVSSKKTKKKLLQNASIVLLILELQDLER